MDSLQTLVLWGKKKKKARGNNCMFVPLARPEWFEVFEVAHQCPTHMPKIMTKQWKLNCIF